MPRKKKPAEIPIKRVMKQSQRLSLTKLLLISILMCFGLTQVQFAMAADMSCIDRALANEVKMRRVELLPEDQNVFEFLSSNARRESDRQKLETQLLEELRRSVANLKSNSNGLSHLRVAMAIYEFLRRTGLKVQLPEPATSWQGGINFRIEFDLDYYRKALSGGQVKFATLPREVKIALSVGVDRFQFTTEDILGGGAGIEQAGTDINLSSPTYSPELKSSFAEREQSEWGRILRIITVGPMTSLLTHELGHIKVIRAAIGTERRNIIASGNAYFFKNPPRAGEPPGRYVVVRGLTFRGPTGHEFDISLETLNAGLGRTILPIVKGRPVRFDSSLSHASYLPFNSPQAMRAILANKMRNPNVGDRFEVTLPNTSRRVTGIMTSINESQVELRHSNGILNMSRVEFGASNPVAVAPDFGQATFPALSFLAASNAEPLTSLRAYGRFFAIDEIAQFSLMARTANQRAHRLLLELLELERQRNLGQEVSQERMRSLFSQVSDARYLAELSIDLSREFIRSARVLLRRALQRAQNPANLNEFIHHGLMAADLDLSNGQTMRYYREQAYGMSLYDFLSRTLHLVDQFGIALDERLNYSITIPARVNAARLPDTPEIIQAQDWPNERAAAEENSRLILEFRERNPSFR